MDIAESLYYKEINKKLFRKNHINQLFGLTRMSTKCQSALFRKPGMGGAGRLYSQSSNILMFLYHISRNFLLSKEQCTHFFKDILDVSPLTSSKEVIIF